MIAALVAPDARDGTAAGLIERALPTGDHAERQRLPHAALAATLLHWERALDGDALAAADGVAVAADASLYHRDDLLRALHAAAAPADPAAGAAALVLAAWRAWGEGLAERLEGDFAFVVVDARRGVVVAARDFVGRRALHFARLDDALVLASTPAAVVAHPRCPTALNLPHVAGRAAGLLEADDTAHAAVALLPAGHTLVARIAPDGSMGAPTLRRHWTPPTFESPGAPFDEAARQLRARLDAAVAERLAPAGDGAVWLSGGYDSPAVYGVGQALLRARDDGRRLRAVSMSYPPGDAGREDELIAAVAARWGEPVCWRSVRDVPVFGDDAAERAAVRDGPFAHAFERWMATLAAAARDAGARVVFDGVGGDHLFQLSAVYLADLVVTGRWAEARAEWRRLAPSGAGWRAFARVGLLPRLPAAGWRLLAVLRGGRPVRGLREGLVPDWITPDSRAAIADRAERRLGRRPGESAGAAESRWFFDTTYSPAVLSEQRAIARSAGVDVRSPLLDGRIVALAATRPRAERSGGGEVKRLLRHAVRNSLPEEILRPRPYRTGVTSHYFRRAMLAELPAIAGRTLRSSRLAELGMVDPDRFRRAVERYAGTADAAMGAALFATIQAELWLRARA